MIYILAIVNTELVENHPDLKFSSMDALLDYVKQEGYEWTSLVVTILPA